MPLLPAFEPADDEKMSAQKVLELLQLFDKHGITVVVDGGWGVEALLGQQTRRHNDTALLCEQFGIALPDEYTRFLQP